MRLVEGDPAETRSAGWKVAVPSFHVYQTRVSRAGTGHENCPGSDEVVKKSGVRRDEPSRLQTREEGLQEDRVEANLGDERETGRTPSFGSETEMTLNEVLSAWVSLLECESSPE